MDLAGFSYAGSSYAPNLQAWRAHPSRRATEGRSGAAGPARRRERSQMVVACPWGEGVCPDHEDLVRPSLICLCGGAREGGKGDGAGLIRVWAEGTRLWSVAWHGRTSSFWRGCRSRVASFQRGISSSRETSLGHWCWRVTSAGCIHPAALHHAEGSSPGTGRRRQTPGRRGVDNRGCPMAGSWGETWGQAVALRRWGERNGLPVA